jgi:hypothetical protein
MSTEGDVYSLGFVSTLPHLKSAQRAMTEFNNASGISDVINMFPKKRITTFHSLLLPQIFLSRIIRRKVSDTVINTGFPFPEIRNFTG